MSFSFKELSGNLDFHPQTMKGIAPGWTESCTVTLDAHSMNEADHGLLDRVVPIRIQRGPSIAVHVKAQIIEPRIHLSSNKLDFGSVMIGFAKVFYRRVLSEMYFALDTISAIGESNSSCLSLEMQIERSCVSYFSK